MTGYNKTVSSTNMYWMLVLLTTIVLNYIDAVPVQESRRCPNKINPTESKYYLFIYLFVCLFVCLFIIDTSFIFAFTFDILINPVRSVIHGRKFSLGGQKFTKLKRGTVWLILQNWSFAIFPDGRLAHPESQNEEENEQNLRKNNKICPNFEEK